MLAYSGKGKFVVQPVRLDRLVQEMAKLLNTVVSRKAIMELDLKPATVEGDATQLRQVVMNLITNASDALESNVGKICVRTGVQETAAADLRSPFLPEELPPGSYAFVEIEDTGCGMSEETMRKIFDPFFSTKFTGRGLGLAAVLGIVRGDRGTTKVASTPGQGTRFQVLLPGAAPITTDRLAPGRQMQPRHGSGTVLVVDDEPSVREFAQRVLESGGFTVHWAEDGEHGLRVFAQHRHGIVAVLLDLTMPRMDGVEVLRQLRALSPDVPVAVMSGYSEMDIARRFEGMRVDGFLQKPFVSQDLLTLVSRMVPPNTAPRSL
ncbi:MAG: response regulator [Verrucomicrobia bacterium]|nr:response regulator [Verrucomicrobiota bacterium]